MLFASWYVQEIGFSLYTCLPAANAVKRRRGMEAVVQADIDHVDVISLEHLVIVGVDMWDIVLRGNALAPRPRGRRR